LDARLAPVDRIYWLLEDCGEFGVAPFVGQARRAFIATEILRSFVRANIIEAEVFERFMTALNTIARRFQFDLQHSTIEELMTNYGHLRPGTYDIRSPRYDEAPQLFFQRVSNAAAPMRNNKPFLLNTGQLHEIQAFLDRNGIPASAEGLLDFAHDSIEARENTKFAFTRNLSDALAGIAALGEELGFSREDLSYLNVRELLATYATAANIRDAVSQSIKRGKRAFEATNELLLPALIRNEEEVVSFVRTNDQPNFIGKRVVLGRVQPYSGSAFPTQSIIFIESADPGYEWVFGRDLAGLVTMYGGGNSHMAIRAHELGITSVIGAGINQFTRWATAHLLRIDPVNRKVEVVQ
jgi:hypothetical protein